MAVAPIKEEHGTEAFAVATERYRHEEEPQEEAAAAALSSSNNYNK